jgi:hypothetical protein
MGGGGFVTGIITHPRQKGLMYARTDVGGAYRWDDSAQRWIPITDWMGMADASLTGIESITVDPNDPQRVYVAAGIYNGGNAAILRSDDQGKTFQRTDVPFKMGGNESGRFLANGSPWIPIKAAFFSSARGMTDCGRAPTGERHGRKLKVFPTSAPPTKRRRRLPVRPPVSVRVSAVSASRRSAS